MRRLPWWFLPAAALVLSGCGNRNLVMHVDVLSYLDPSVTQFSIGPVPAMLPNGIQTGETPVVQDADVNLIEGMTSVASIQNVTIRLTVVAACGSGSGADTLRLYLGEAGQDPMVMGPVLEAPIVFVAGVTDTVTVESSGDVRMADLFDQDRLKLTLTNALHGPSSGDALNADLEIIGLDATLVAGRKGL